MYTLVASKILTEVKKYYGTLVTSQCTNKNLRKISKIYLICPLTLILQFAALLRQKGRDLTQSYDKSPYTNGNVKRAK